MQRLYLQIYLSVVGILLLLALSLSVTMFYLAPADAFGLDRLAALAPDLLPPPDASKGHVDAALERLSRRIGVSLALFDEGGRPMGAAGETLPGPDPRWPESRILHSGGRGATMALRLDDGRWLVVRYRQRAHAFAALVAMSLAGVAVAIGSYPVVRRLTRRLERLQEQVEALGKGELGARVEVEGRDEVAKLAASFNQAAARIERLVDAQRTLLAGASHELRSPLARIRMAVELLGEGNSAPSLLGRIEDEIEALDELIGELILATRIETQPVRQEEAVDLLALAAEEAAHYGCSMSGVPVAIRGDRALVRRLLRNLLENARRYAPGAPIDVDVGPGPMGRGARILVMDRGAGIPEEERERIFEPFYQLRSSARPPDGGGVGLGLALVKKIARLHAGQAICRAREGGGSVFEVTLEDIRV
jgi:signal transduction histidine kinase